MSQHSDSSQLVLYIWPGQWGLPSIDPSCLAAVLYLQLAIPGGFHIAECTNPDLSPSGQLPFLTHLHHTISSLPSIFKYVSAQHLFDTTRSPNLDAVLSTSEKAQQVAWCAHVESNLGNLVAHMFYSLNSNWYGLTLPTLANMLYIPQRYYVPARLRESYRPRLEAAELWSLPAIDQENEKKRFEQKPKEEGGSQQKEAFKRVFEREKVIEKARSFLDIYARLLGKKQFFLLDDQPTTLDVYVAPYILLLLDAPFPDPLLRSLLKESYPTLTAHARRIHLRALPTTGSDIPMRPRQGYSLGSLIPWPAARLARKSKQKKKTADDIRFDRMRWGWITLAAFSAAFYIARTDFRLKLVPAAELVEENETLGTFEADEDEEE